MEATARDQEEKTPSRGQKTLKSVAQAIEKIDDKEVSIFASSRKDEVDSPFVLLFSKNLTDLLVDDKLKNTDIKVIFGICSIAQFGNLVSINQSGLAESLKITQSMVSLSIKKLTAEGILLKTKLGLFINPSLIVKGNLHKVDPNLWDVALSKGFSSPVKKVAKKQTKLDF